MELFLSIFEIIAWIVAFAFVICAIWIVAAAAYYAYIEMKEAEEDE
jgi:hypothetical protein